MATSLGKLCAILLLTFSLHVGCGTGTETGNPGGPPSGAPADEEGSSTDEPSPELASSPIDDLIDELCTKINECDTTISIELCTDALNGPDGEQLDDEFGLPEGQFTIDEIRNGLADGSIISDTDALTSCAMDIFSLECTAVLPNVSIDNFANVENFIPVSCADVFSLTP